MRAFVRSFIERAVARAATATPYRRPLVGFAAADDPAWLRLRQVADPAHYLPSELLPGARTVVAFFIPFGPEVVQANRKAQGVAREWALAYVETNALIQRIVDGLAAALAERGVRAVGRPPTHDYDPVRLTSRWSNKSAAALAGLGSFGLHRLLITDMGCAGRCGSLILDASLEPTSGPQPERCLHFHDGSCALCVETCPATALRVAPRGELNLDRAACDAFCRTTEERFADLGGRATCCGKCATAGPCALGPAV
ncbi:MAG: epoxyqueuosine reductase [Anaerolineae bacterium]